MSDAAVDDQTHALAVVAVERAELLVEALDSSAVVVSALAGETVREENKRHQRVAAGLFTRIGTSPTAIFIGLVILCLPIETG